MKSIGCVIPDDNTLTRFNCFCEPLFAEQEKLEEENEKLSTIRDTLLPKLMNGEIKIELLKKHNFILDGII
jgi:type I restriction enzyme, S subunit